MGWFSTPSTPTPPPPPSASEISAANVESARGLTRLQRAMQFGLPLTKAGVRQEGDDIPKNAKKRYGDKDYAEIDGPTFIGTSEATSLFKIDAQGLVSDIMPSLEKGIPSLTEVRGKPYQDIWKQFPEWENSMPRGGKQHIFRKDGLKDQLLGWETPDGEVIEAPAYFQVQDSTGKTADEEGFDKATAKEVKLTREEALDADFSQMGDTDIARMQFAFEKETSPEQNEFILAQAKKYGLGEGLVDADGKPTMGFIEAAAEGVKKADPLAYDVRKALADKALGYEASGVPTVDEMERFGEFGKLPTAETLKTPTDPLGEALSEEFGGRPVYEGPETVMEEMRRMEAGKTPTFRETTDAERPTLTDAGAMADLDRLDKDAPSLERLEKKDIPDQVADPQSMAARRDALARFGQRIQGDRTERLMADEAQRIARGRAAARGNIFGGGAVVDEAVAVQQARDAAERQGLQDLVGFLQSGQTAEDYEGRLAQQNLANRLMGIQQRTGAEQAEFGMRGQIAGQRNTASLQERADELAAIGQRNEVQQQEFQNLQASLAQINQTKQAQLAAEMQTAGFDNTVIQQERADELGAMSQRNEAEEAEFRSLLQGLQQQQAARTGGFGMEAQAMGQRNAAQEADFAKEQAAMAQRNAARQQSFTNAMQRTATQEQMQQQQMANLQSFSGLAPVSTQFAGLSGAQQQAGASFNPMQYQRTDAGQLLQGQQNLAASNFGTQAGIWGQQAQAAAQPSGFGSLLGTVAGGYAGSEAGAAAIGKGAIGSAFGAILCHTARLVFGEDNPEWVKFYLWKEHKAPKWFRSLYNKYTERVASWLKDKPRLQTIVRNWMRRKFNG